MNPHAGTKSPGPGWERVSRSRLSLYEMRRRKGLIMAPLRNLMTMPPGDVLELGEDEKGRRTVTFKTPARTLGELLAQELVARALYGRGSAGLQAMQLMVRMVDGYAMDRERAQALKAAMEQEGPKKPTQALVVVHRGLATAPKLPTRENGHEGNGNGHEKAAG